MGKNPLEVMLHPSALAGYLLRGLRDKCANMIAARKLGISGAYVFQNRDALRRMHHPQEVFGSPKHKTYAVWLSGVLLGELSDPCNMEQIVFPHPDAPELRVFERVSKKSVDLRQRIADGVGNALSLGIEVYLSESFPGLAMTFHDPESDGGFLELEPILPWSETHQRPVIRITKKHNTDAYEQYWTAFKRMVETSTRQESPLALLPEEVEDPRSFLKVYKIEIHTQDVELSRVLSFRLSVFNTTSGTVSFPDDHIGEMSYENLGRTVRAGLGEPERIERGNDGVVVIRVRLPDDDTARAVADGLNDGEPQRFNWSGIKIPFALDGKGYELATPEGVTVTNGLRVGNTVYLRPGTGRFRLSGLGTSTPPRPPDESEGPGK